MTGARAAARDASTAAAVLSVLADEDCRAFLRELDEPLTARALSRRCDVPPSTTYRKLDRLSAVDLVAVSTVVRDVRRARYRRTVDSLTVDVTDGGVLVEAGDDTRTD